MKCPKCESDNTQRLEVAFHSGTQNIATTSKSLGIGFSGGKIGLGGGLTGTSGQTQSALAAACSPPIKKRVIKRGSLIFISTCLPLFSLGVHWACFVFSLVVIGLSWRQWKLNSKYNSEVWSPLYQRWTESWICHKCGNVYQQAC